MSNKNNDIGYIYVIYSKHGWKIGKSKNPKERYSLFSVKLPFEIKLKLVLMCLDYHNLERILHLKFKEQRLNGEWFSLKKSDIEHIYFYCYFWNKERAVCWNYKKWDRFVKKWDNKTLPMR